MSERKTKLDWIPPSPDLYSPNLWVKNKNFKEAVLIHGTPGYPGLINNPYNNWVYRLDEFSDIDLMPKDGDPRFPSSYAIIPIKRMQVRHLPYSGQAYDGNRELCYVPWVLDYLKEVLHGTDRD